MIISASRRTDIPAFYADWLAERIRAGYCLVKNPFNSTQPIRPKEDISDSNPNLNHSNNIYKPAKSHINLPLKNIFYERNNPHGTNYF